MSRNLRVWICPLASNWVWLCLIASSGIAALGCAGDDDGGGAASDTAGRARESDSPRFPESAAASRDADRANEAPRFPASTAGPPDILLISIDTLRPDHLGTYGYERDTSPVLDSLAARGATFENAFAQSSWTLPSHVSLMTSTYPAVHQVDTERRSLPESIPTLAESLQARGYETTGFVSWIYLAAKFGFARGFDRYDELVPSRELQDSSSKHSVRAAGIVDSVLSWAYGHSESHDPMRERGIREDSAMGDGESEKGKDTHRKGSASSRPPFFLFVHFFDPHMDYDPPLADARSFDPAIESTEAGSYDALKPYIAGLSADVPPIPEKVIGHAIDLYDAEIRYTDRELGRLLDGLRRLGLLDHAVIVVTSDHGEEFGEHGSMEGHQWTLYDEVLHVPLLVAAPGLDQGIRISRIVESIDIAPTLLRWAGIEAPPSYQGRPLQELLTGTPGARADGRSLLPPVEWEERAFAELGRFVIRASLRTPDHKLIYTKDTHGKSRLGVPIEPGFELFDLHADPLEHDNLYADDSPVARQLTDRLRAWAAHRGALPSIVEPQLTAEERERLRSVGYIGR